MALKSRFYNALRNVGLSSVAAGLVMTGAVVPGLSSPSTPFVPLFQPLALPVASPFAVYSVIKPAAYTGPHVRLSKVGGTTFDVPYTTNNIPDYAASDAWAAGEEVRISIRYDVSGNGRNMVMATWANMPAWTALQQFNGLRPVSFDAWAQATTGKSMEMSFAATPLDRQNYAVLHAVRAKSFHNGNSYFQTFNNADFTNTTGETGGAIYGVSDAIGIQRGPAAQSTWQQPVRAHLTTVSYSTGPFGASAANRLEISLSGVRKNDLVTTAGSLQSMTVGRLSLGGNYHSGFDSYVLAVYPRGLSTAETASVETYLEGVLSVQKTGWTKLLLVGHNSLSAGHSAPLQQNLWNQAGFGRPDRGQAAWETYVQASVGRTLTVEVGGQSLWHLNRFDVTKDVNIYFIGEPTNDWSVTTFATLADAETAANNKYTNELLPQIAAWKAKTGNNGKKGRVVVPTSIARAEFVTTNATNHREDARLKYNQLVRDGATANGYFVADFAGISGLSDANNATYFNQTDKLHLLPAGYALEVPVALAAIAAAEASAT